MRPTEKPGRSLRARFVRVRDGQGLKIVPMPEAREDLAVSLRVARLLALAHRIEARIEIGEITDRAAAARELGVSRARITQILDLTLLAPEIQEEILSTRAEPGFQPINERSLRWVLRARDWPTQRSRWSDLRAV